VLVQVQLELPPQVLVLLLWLKPQLRGTILCLLVVVMAKAVVLAVERKSQSLRRGDLCYQLTALQRQALWCMGLRQALFLILF
jgi:hypothetical protein